MLNYALQEAITCSFYVGKDSPVFYVFLMKKRLTEFWHNDLLYNLYIDYRIWQTRFVSFCGANSNLFKSSQGVGQGIV